MERNEIDIESIREGELLKELSRLINIPTDNSIMRSLFADMRNWYIFYTKQQLIDEVFNPDRTLYEGKKFEVMEILNVLIGGGIEGYLFALIRNEINEVNSWNESVYKDIYGGNDEFEKAVDERAAVLLRDFKKYFLHDYDIGELKKHVLRRCCDYR